MSASWRVYGADRPEGSPVELGIGVPKSLHDPGGYVPDPGLVDAVNVAIALGQPLLVTGEPGTGKTQLAYSLAHQLFRAPPIVFNTKTTSAARDLFYQYDALRHFRDAQLRQGGEAPRPGDYITFEALGLAILLAMPRAEVAGVLPASFRNAPRTRSVVLIDEIDKAPRDLPNDVLNEIEQMRFEVRETSQEYAADPEFRPIIVLTSNSEKLLPDAFLRRCVYYHLPFPDREQLTRIVQLRLGDGSTELRDWIGRAVAEFERIRAKPLKKKPATAELLAWLRALELLAAEQAGDPAAHPGYLRTMAILAKNKDDLDAMTGQAMG